MKIAVSSYSFNQYIKAGKMTLQDTVDKAAEMGFAGIEFIDLPKEMPRAERMALAADLRQRVEKNGLSMVAYTVAARLWQPTEALLRAEIERVKGEVDITVLLGAPVMRHDLVWELDKTGAGRSFRSMMPKLAETVREIADYAAQKGIKTCSENHGRIAQDSDRMEAFAALVNHDHYGLLVDMGNFLCVDEDPITAVSRVANYAFHAHAKDMLICSPDTDGGVGIIKTRGMNGLKPTAIGHGSVPVKQCIAILKRAGYDGWLSVEYEGKEDCLQGIAEGLKNLRMYLSELEK
ncbi:MAG: sugar phosphate isomerase/epimerase [Ruminococcaceae bacterium]|nr:sugar phosphate isomerase/epimerase [Oscillospiraceae bacterium]